MIAECECGAAFDGTDAGWLSDDGVWFCSACRCGAWLRLYADSIEWAMLREGT